MTAGAPPPAGILGRRGFIHDAKTRALLAVLGSWSLLEGGLDASSVVRAEAAEGWALHEWAGPIRVTLEHENGLLAATGFCVPKVVPWTWQSLASMERGRDLLDKFDVPAADRVELGGGAVWLVRAIPRRKVLTRALKKTARTGSLAFGDLFEAYSGGFEGLDAIGRLSTEQVAALKEYLLTQATAGISAITPASAPEA